MRIASGWFEIVYEDRDCTVLHILDQKAEPEPEDSGTTDPGTMLEIPLEENRNPAAEASPPSQP